METTIKTIDIPKLCTEWLIRTHNKSCNNVDVSRLHLKWSELEWPTTYQGPRLQETSRNVHIDFPHQRNTFCDLRVTPDSLVQSKVVLSETVVKGLNKTFNIPIPSDAPEEAKTICNKKCKVDPGKELVENTYNSHAIEEGSQKSNGLKVAAKIKVLDNFFEGQFIIKASLTGEVLFNNGTMAMNIGQIVQQMKQFYGNDLKNFTILRDCESHSAPTGLSWRINGNFKLTWHPSIEIEWS